MENIKAVIFDIDGTLADSLDVWAEADRIFHTLLLILNLRVLC